MTRPNTDHAQDGKPASTGALANVKLEPGANSFTESEARRRLEKDADGIRVVSDNGRLKTVVD